MDVRIGLTQTPKELEVQLDEGTDPGAVRAQVDSAIGEGSTLWFTDRKGRQIGVPGREARLRRDRQPQRGAPDRLRG